MEHQDNKDEVGGERAQSPGLTVDHVPPTDPTNYVPPAPQFPRVDWNVKVWDKHGNPTNVLLERPNPTNDVPPATQFPTVDCNIQVSDKHGNPVNVLLEPPNPPLIHYDVSWGTREQWKELAEELLAYHIAYNKFRFERDRQYQLALGQHRGDGSTSNQTHEPSCNPGEDSNCKRQAAGEDGPDVPTTNP